MVKRLFSIAAFILTGLLVVPVGVAATKQPLFEVQRPTILAFFAPVSQAELKENDGTNEALSDFQFYAARVRQPLRQAGIDFREVYAYSFQIRIEKRVTTFKPEKVDVGYYFVAPGKKPLVQYGVMTAADLLALAHEYFGIRSK